MGLRSLCCPARDVLAGLVNPPVCLRIADEVEEPTEKGETVAASESEPCRVGGKGIGKGARIINRHLAVRLGQELADRPEHFSCIRN